MKWAFLPIPQYAKVHKSVGIGKALRQKAERKQSKRVGAYMDRSAVLNKLTEQYLYSSTQILSRQYWSTYKEVLEILSLHFSFCIRYILFIATEFYYYQTQLCQCQPIYELLPP